MKSLNALLAALTAIAAGGACAQTAPLAYTDAAPYTDIAVPAVSSTGAHQLLEGPAHARRSTGGDAAGPHRRNDRHGRCHRLSVCDEGLDGAGIGAAGVRRNPGRSPGDGLTADGYRFVGGEAGYVYVGHARAAR
jgi:hypothetical protein